jgi:hypothetical protein
MNDDFNFDGGTTQTTRGAMEIWDILSIVMLVLTVCLVIYFLIIFINPGSNFNILPPGGKAVFGPQTPTATAAPIQLQPTWTASPTLQLTPSETPRPTFTPYFTNTPFSLVPPTRTPRPTKTPKAPFSASTQQVESTVIHQDLACNWAGIGGTITDVNGSQVVGMVVVLRGTLNGTTIEQQTVSGINKEYGQSGFEFVLGNAPVESKATLYVQLVDLQNIPLSDPVYVNTSSDCTKNLVLVRFKKNR